MKSLYFIILIIIIIFILVLYSSSYKKEHMMEFVEAPAGVIISIPAMQMSYCSLDTNLQNTNIPNSARCYPYKCINKRNKITCRNEPCWADEIYYKGEVKCGGFDLSPNKTGEYKCNNKYNKNYDCDCKPDWKTDLSVDKNEKKNIIDDSKKNIIDDSKKNTICIDPCSYRYYSSDDYPCDVHYIQGNELEPNLNNYGNKICLINDNYDFVRRKKCNSSEISLLQQGIF